MEIYLVNLNSPKLSLRQRSVHVLILSGAFFLLRFGGTFLWPTSFERNRGILGNAIESAVASLLWGICMGYWQRKLPKCKLMVDDESITSVMEYTGWMKWWVIRRTISKGKVRSTWEVKGLGGIPRGTAFSERSRAAGRIRGFVYVPSTLPEHESIQKLAESWRAPDATN